MVTLLILLWLASAGASAADTEGGIEFEVGRCHDSVCVWLNLSDLLSSSRVTHLKEGVPVLVVLRCELIRPRRLWGHEQLTSTSWQARLAHRPVTEDYSLQLTDDREIIFASLARLHRYLSDSVTLSITPIDSVHLSTSYKIKTRTSLLWLTTLNVSPDDEESNSPSSLIRLLFGHFLDFSGYGREEFESESGSFKPSGLPLHIE